MIFKDLIAVMYLRWLASAITSHCHNLSWFWFGESATSLFVRSVRGDYLYNLSGWEFWEDFIAADTVCKANIGGLKHNSQQSIKKYIRFLQKTKQSEKQLSVPLTAICVVPAAGYRQVAAAGPGWCPQWWDQHSWEGQR